MKNKFEEFVRNYTVAEDGFNPYYDTVEQFMFEQFSDSNIGCLNNGNYVIETSNGKEYFGTLEALINRVKVCFNDEELTLINAYLVLAERWNKIKMIEAIGYDVPAGVPGSEIDRIYAECVEKERGFERISFEGVCELEDSQLEAVSNSRTVNVLYYFIVKILGQVVDVVKSFREGTLNEVFNDLMHKHLISDHELWAMRIRTMYAKRLEVA